MSVKYTIICDACRRLIESRGTSAFEARVGVRLAGGRTNLPGGRDVCGWCVRDGRKPDPKPEGSES